MGKIKKEWECGQIKVIAKYNPATWVLHLPKFSLHHHPRYSYLPPGLCSCPFLSEIPSPVPTYPSWRVPLDASLQLQQIFRDFTGTDLPLQSPGVPASFPSTSYCSHTMYNLPRQGNNTSGTGIVSDSFTA